MKTRQIMILATLLCSQTGFSQDRSEIDALKKIVASQQVQMEKMRRELYEIRNEILVVSSDYSDPKLNGTFFMFWNYQVDRALNSTDWDGKTFKVRKKGSPEVYEVILLRNRIQYIGRNSSGDGYGRLVKNSAPGQWRQGDVLVFVK